jgi:microcystin-dependent protein
MSQPYVGEIRMFGGNFAPVGWAFCDGQPLPISENETLFNLIGTTYGGDGQETFRLPDLRSRVPVHATHATSDFQLGETRGVEEVILSPAQLPAHNHAMLASTGTGTSVSPAGNVVGQASVGGVSVFFPAAPSQTLGRATSPAGSNLPHNNMMPYACVSFIISLFGVFPPPS